MTEIKYKLPIKSEINEKRYPNDYTINVKLFSGCILVLPMVKGEEQKVKKPAFFSLGGITEEQVKRKALML